MRDRGYHAFVVERWNSFAHIRIDFAGFADILCFKQDQGNPAQNGNGVIAIQATSTDNVSARLQKIRQNPFVRDFLVCGNQLIVQGWAKRGERGKRKTYQLREIPVYLENLVDTEPIKN